jgi:hypothetical protein
LASLPEFVDVRRLLGDREFMKLTLGFGIGLGIFNGAARVLQSATRNHDFSH